MAGGRHYYDLAAFTLYVRDKNSDLTGMASISHNFLIYKAVFLGVVTLNSHLKGNDCGSFTLSFYKKKLESILASTQLSCLCPLHCQKLAFKPPCWRCQSNATSHLLVLLDWGLDWLCLQPEIRTNFIVSVCQTIPLCISFNWCERENYQVKMCLVRFSSAKMCNARRGNKHQ